MKFVPFFRIMNIIFNKISYSDVDYIDNIASQIFTKSSLNWGVSSTHLKLFTGNVYEIDHLCQWFTSQHLRYNESLFLS